MKTLAYLENHIELLHSRKKWLTIELQSINENITNTNLQIADKTQKDLFKPARNLIKEHHNA